MTGAMSGKIHTPFWAIDCTAHNLEPELPGAALSTVLGVT